MKPTEQATRNPQQPFVITLCGVQGCCPTIEVGADEVTIRDDFGGVVKLTKQQWDDLCSRVAK